LHGRGKMAGVAVDERDELAHRHVAVGVLARVAVAREAAQPTRGQEPQRVPPFGTPGVGHLAALEDDMIDRASGQVVAHRQAGMTGADDDGSDSLSHRRGQLTSTVTFVGLVMMSYTAERFWDWATSALTSSGEASASMSYFTVMPLKPLRTSGSA